MDTDGQTVSDILLGNELTIKYFFFEECTPMFKNIKHEIFDYHIDRYELINELYLYLRENDWQKLRQFDYHCKLTTWVWEVAMRFFAKKRDELIENESSEHLMPKQIAEDYYPFLEEEGENEEEKAENTLNRLKNKRYRYVIQKLVLEDYKPQKLADEMGITVDNLYNIKRRALQRLKKITKK